MKSEHQKELADTRTHLHKKINKYKTKNLQLKSAAVSPLLPGPSGLGTGQSSIDVSAPPTPVSRTTK